MIASINKLARSETQLTHVVRLTPNGRGAVATLLVEGPNALRVVEGCLTQTISGVSDNRLILRRVWDTDGEQTVLRRRSYDSIELHCHGGRAAVATIEAALVERGCEPIDWKDWSRLHEKDSTTAAAAIALADARTIRTASILLDQYNGVLKNEFDAIGRAFQCDDFNAVERMVLSLLSHADLTRHLTEPWRVVVAGRTNVGKSSLINAILGYNRAIVHHKPGTTRDVVTAETVVDGWPIVLADTAGLRNTDEPIESIGVQLAGEEVNKADLVIRVFDATEPWSNEDDELIELCPSAIVVHNKIDIATNEGECPTGLKTSAITGDGVEQLVRTISERLVPNPPPPNSPVLVTEDQIESLVDVANAMSCGDQKTAAKLFLQVVGDHRIA